MSNIRYRCRKTYTNGKDDTVHEIYFILTVVKCGGFYMVCNLTDNTLWEHKYTFVSNAIRAIKNGSWAVIEEFEPTEGAVVSNE